MLEYFRDGDIHLTEAGAEILAKEIKDKITGLQKGYFLVKKNQKKWNWTICKSIYFKTMLWTDKINSMLLKKIADLLHKWNFDDLVLLACGSSL